jgi:hypothetical protein
MKSASTGVQASPPSGSYVGVASDLRRLVSSDLARANRAGTGGDDYRSDFWENGYALVPSLPLQVPIAGNGFTPYVVASSVTDQVASSTPVGYVTLARSFAATLTAGTNFELHTPLPPVSDDDGMTSILSFLNRACDTMVRPRRVSIAGVTGQTRYDLSSYGVNRREQVGAVYAPETDATIEPYPMDDGAWGVREDGEKLYLCLYGAPWGTGFTFNVDLSLPLSAWVKVGATWATSTVGLVNESDQVAGDVGEIVLVSSYLAYDELANDDAMAERGSWAKLRDRFAAAATPLMQYAPLPVAPQRGAGNVMGDSWSYLRNRSIGSNGGWSGGGGWV